MKKAWWKESVVYEIYPRSFFDSNGDGIGDLNGITEKLDYLKDLGINVIWLAPVYSSPNDDNGYDISDYRNIMEEFGTMEDYDRLLHEAHKKGIKIVMDLVANHSSDEHAWFLESRSSRDNDKRDYYIWRDPVDGKPPTNWGNSFGGSAWEWDEKTGQYYLHCFSRKQPDLNWDNPRVRQEIFDIMKFWCDKGIDGFRMDVINMISKKEEFVDGPVYDGVYGSLAGEVFNGPHLHEYLQEMNREVLSKYDIMTVGECGGTGPKEARQIANAKGTELGMIFQFEHVDLDCGEHGKWSTKKISLPALKKNLSRWQKDLDEMAWNSLYFCNHDQPRVVSRLGDNSPVSAKAIAVAIYSLQGTPYLYQGEELGMTNYPFKRIDDFNDIESIGAFRQLGSTGSFKPEELFEAIAYKSRDNARTPMQWSDEDYAGFTTGTPWFHVNPNYKTINAEAQVKDPDSVFSFYKEYIALRTKSKWKDVLVYGKYQLLAPEDESVFAYLRYDENHTLLVVSNLSPKMREFELTPEEWAMGFSEEGKYKMFPEAQKKKLAPENSEEAGQCLISTYPDTTFAGKLKLRPWEAFIQVIR